LRHGLAKGEEQQDGSQKCMVVEWSTDTGLVQDILMLCGTYTIYVLTLSCSIKLAVKKWFICDTNQYFWVLAIASAVGN